MCSAVKSPAQLNPKSFDAVRNTDSTAEIRNPVALICFSQTNTVDVLSSVSVRSYSWSFPVDTEISYVCVSCLTSRRMDDVGWGSLRCVIIICESPVYHLDGVRWLQVGEIYSLLEVLTLTLTSVSGQELSPVPWLHSLGHAMQRGSLRSSSASWNLTVCMDPWLPWLMDNAEHLLLLPPSWSFLQDALPSHFIFKTVYTANSDFSSRALPHICIHYSQVSVLNTVVDKRCPFGYSITKTIIVFYKPGSTVVTQHLHWSIIKN